LGVSDFPELGKEYPSKLQSDTSADLFKSPELGKFLTLDEIEERYIRKVIKETDKTKGKFAKYWEFPGLPSNGNWKNMVSPLSGNRRAFEKRSSAALRFAFRHCGV